MYSLEADEGVVFYGYSEILSSGIAVALLISK